MKQNRKIPFGYRMTGAEVGIDEKEADVVRRIFKLYSTGKTLKQITDLLNEEGIVYHESNPSWNKPMVHRLLSNTKYLGGSGYPQIIDEDTFQLASQQADSRKKFLPPDSPAENVLENKVFCSCGSRLRNDSNDRWVCAMCRKDAIAEKKLLALICNAFELIADDPDIIQVEPKDKEYIPSTEILRLNSEIRRRIDLAEPEEVESVKSDILQCALLKYQSFEEDLTPYISRTLSQEFAAEAPIEESCPLLIKKTVSSIMLADHNRLQIKLRNGAIITTGRDD